MNTILYRDKVLIHTLSSPIYQNENRVDLLKFLISVDYLSDSDIKALNCMICITLPNGQEGKVGFLDLEDALYHDKYLLSYIPITEVFTKLPGTIYVKLVLSYEDSNNLFHYLPANNISLTMIESSRTDDFIDPDKNTNPSAEITQKIQSLEESRISSIDIDGHTVHLYADSEKTTLIGTVALPGGAVWTTMEVT